MCCKLLEIMLGAVQPQQQPQAGVKRPLMGKPTNVPNNLPAFRGREVAPGGSVKVPKLGPGNRPNEGTNIAIPYNRVCPLEFLSGWAGRLAPGDVAFVVKHPPGFLSSAGATAANKTNATGTMSRVVGLDGLNRMLHGGIGGNVNGWRIGENVLMTDKPTDLKEHTEDFEEYANGALRAPPDDDSDLNDYRRYVPDSTLRTTLDNALDEDKWRAALLVAKAEHQHELLEYQHFGETRHRLSVLEDTRLDGVIKSNDEPYSFTSNGSRDAVVFNNVIQGPTLVNNGYLVYDPNDNPSRAEAKKSRTVEAHPRGSIEGGYHLGGRSSTTDTRQTVVGSQSWLSTGQYDYVAAFTGTYTSYPAQMFDRHVQPMNSLYLGLRAYVMSDELKKKITKADGTDLTTEEQAKTCYFYQYMPFASRKAWCANPARSNPALYAARPPATCSCARALRVVACVVDFCVFW